MSTATLSKPATVTIPQETPMMRQYRDIKAQHMDAILFFRLGDFYEMFLDDATVAAKELNLTLTGRGKDENRIAMCGIPYHASDGYIAKLVAKGFKVAICEQVEDAAESKGITRREVVKIVTPGTILSESGTDDTENHFIAAVYSHRKSGQIGVSFADITTGEFRVTIVPQSSDLNALLTRLEPKEILSDNSLNLEAFSTVLHTPFEALDIDRASQHLCTHFKLNSLSGFGLDAEIDAAPAAWALLDYLKSTQKSAVDQITRLLGYGADTGMQMDAVTQRNLELTHNISTNSRKGSLLDVLDFTKTAMGARKLKHYLKAPLLCKNKIETRLDAVETLKNDLLSREEIRDILNQVYDLERLVARIASEHNNPRDCISLAQSLSALPDLKPILSQLDGTLLEDTHDFFAKFDTPESVYQSIVTLIESGIKEDAPATITKGNVIQPGFDGELDALNESFRSIRDWISGLEEVERDRTGIRTLKVGFNKVFGYYFEVPKSQQDKVPDTYIRKQTLTNAERYITPELKEKESILLNGEDRQIELETKLYKSITAKINAQIAPLQELADILAKIDCIQSLATAAQKYNYTRPTLIDPAPKQANRLVIKDGRHPVVERSQNTTFIPNSLTLDETAQIGLITGPNMAGKSTVMRLAALIIVMAQMGSFVPAKSAEITLVDKLFTRIGALDNVYSGQSTFMVEMLETASILNNATQNSFIVLDEIGRGTSTYDGISLASAITHFIHNRIGARTLFATHYHELTQLSQVLARMDNLSMQITESDDTISFDYKLIKGSADKSYGIHVAKMAGLPEDVLDQAQTILDQFETQMHPGHHGQLTLF